MECGIYSIQVVNAILTKLHTLGKLGRAPVQGLLK